MPRSLTRVTSGKPLPHARSSHIKLSSDTDKHPSLLTPQACYVGTAIPHVKLLCAIPSSRQTQPARALAPV
jgi:hypothetical protein